MRDDISNVLTIFVPYYRAPQFLASALASIIVQDTPGWRAVVLDDSGPGFDEAERIVEDLRDARVSYIKHSTNRGMAANWNYAFDTAETTFCSLLHCDDELDSHYASEMIALASRHPDAAAYFCDARTIDAFGRPTRSMLDAVKRFIRPRQEPAVLAGEAAIKTLVSGNYIVGPSLLYRMSEIGSLRFDTKRRVSPDFDFVLRALFAGRTIVGTKQQLYRYRRHDEGSATSIYARTLERYEEESAIYSEIAGLARDSGMPSLAKQADRKVFVVLRIIVDAATDMRKGRFRAASQKLALLRSIRG